MRTVIRTLVLVVAAITSTAFQLKAQEGATLQNLEFEKSDALIQSFIMVAGPQSVRYSLIGGSVDGVKTMRVTCGEKIIVHKECYGLKNCQASGAEESSALPYDVITVSVLSSTQAEQNERIKINLKQGGEKVYMITALPGASGALPMIAASDTSATATTVVETPLTIEVSQEKPVISISINRNAPNEYELMVLSSDSGGVDFIEIMENGQFMDVEICSGQKQCQMKKTLKYDKPGDYVYMIKSMNKKQKVSYQEEIISFEE